MKKTPIVFISYSWDNEDHKDAVLHLAETLRADGIDVVLDRWDLKPGHDKFAFMEQSIEKADKVLIMCDESYVEKANRRTGGVGTETTIITPDIYSKSDQEKFIPIILESSKVMPTYLKSRLGINLTKAHYEKGYKELLGAIYDRPAIVKPDIGQPPKWLEESTPERNSSEDNYNQFYFPSISPRASVMLFFAAENNGEIIVYSTLSGTSYISGRNPLNVSHEPREIAKWEAAIKELINGDYIERVGNKDRIYRVTQRGYDISDRFKNDNDINIEMSPGEILTLFDC